MKKSVEERLLAKVTVDPDTGCWVFSGCLKNGYGYVWLNGSSAITHRVMFELRVGPLTPGMHLDHLCRNRACCNPQHLEEVTAEENGRRTKGFRYNKTHCPEGHAYDAENTYFARNGDRMCKPCRRARTREWRARNREVVSAANRAYLAAHRDELAARKRQQRAAAKAS